jgi:hypothetical protein
MPVEFELYLIEMASLVASLEAPDLLQLVGSSPALAMIAYLELIVIVPQVQSTLCDRGIRSELADKGSPLLTDRRTPHLRPRGTDVQTLYFRH